ncbi:hypothetical protein [uncultured Aliiroseovarius sp.]|uniref:hypothetical protein n=1 Tax=uncultured Aliiroseovarius sp. TaxID=1658783 RepID=UPI002623089F|nr:hypothetical protein [uncultured Aliiroseovarius sp.]
MKQIAKLSAVALVAGIGLAQPIVAEDASPDGPANPQLSEGAELLNRGFKLLLEGLANEVEPMAENWAKNWADLVDRMGDMSVYHPPETLPNGDIIIRRRVPLEPEDTEPSETDL